MKIFAQDFQIPSPPAGFRYKTVSEVISAIFTYAIPFAGILMLLMIVLGGYTLMISAGNPEKIAEGKSRITMGIGGFILVFLNWFILRVLEVIFGIEILT